MDQGTLEPPSLNVAVKDGGVAILELNRPSKRNALSQNLIDELIGTLSQLDRSPTIFVVILTSSGPFSGTGFFSPHKAQRD
jgi:enoyl-CoA hydratase